MSTIQLNGKDFASQTSSAEPVIASGVTGSPALTLTNAIFSTGQVIKSHFYNFDTHELKGQYSLGSARPTLTFTDFFEIDVPADSTLYVSHGGGMASSIASGYGQSWGLSINGTDYIHLAKHANAQEGHWVFMHKAVYFASAVSSVDIKVIITATDSNMEGIMGDTAGGTVTNPAGLYVTILKGNVLSEGAN
tara:strand:+ start:229 stop:804 length:576 start_codon:yes stop_codon:yes gene_type:complete